MTTAHLALLAALVATIIWGATPPIAKLTFQEMPLFITALLRFVIASLLFFPILLFQDKLGKLKVRDFPHLALLSVLGITLSIGLFFIGLNMTTALDAGIIISTGPLFNALAAKIFLGEKVTRLHMAGTIVASVGTLLIVLIQPLSESRPDLFTTILGNSLLLLAVLAGVAFNILSKESFKKFDASIITGFSFLIGSFTFVPLAWWQSNQNPGWSANLSISGILGLLYLGIFASLIAYLIYEWALEKLPLNRTLPMTFLQPVITVAVAVPLLGEKITPIFLIGSVFILIGMFLATYNLPHHHRRSPHHKV